LKLLASCAALPQAAASGKLPSALTPDEREYRITVVREAQSKLIMDTFANDTIDAAWSTDAAALLRNTYRGDDFLGADIQAECRSKLCKLSIKGANFVQVQETVQKMITKAPWPANGMSQLNPQSGEAAVYLSRDGVEIPQVDPDSLAY
jgi:hypothetical protein